MGAIDFAGGTVVHINAGIAGLVGALIIGKRIGYGKELMAPHSLTMSMIGASLLWVRLVRLQRRLQPRSLRRRCTCDGEHLRRHRSGRAVVDVRRVDRQGPPLAARRAVGRGRGPRRGHAGCRLLRHHGRARARPGRRRRVPDRSAPRSRTRSATTTRSTCSASTASAASSARSAPASWSIPDLGGTGVMNYETLKAGLRLRPRR